jgi:D-alanine transaminase
VVPVYGGRPFLLQPHLARLRRSLAAIQLEDPHTEDEWAELLVGLVGQNGGGDLSLYVQVSRGAEWGRNHAIPLGITATVFAFASPLPPISAAVLAHGVAAVTAEELRWRRCDIKSTMLLGNVLARATAAAAGAAEAIFLDGDLVNEGAASAALVVKDGRICAPPESHSILPSTTRALVLELAAKEGLPVRIAPVSKLQLRAADELWICMASRGILPVTTLDGSAIGKGVPGPLFQRLFARFEGYKAEVATRPPLQ